MKLKVINSYQNWLTWKGKEPGDRWASWDNTPWNHPWLTRAHLEEFGDFSKAIRKNLVNQLDHNDAKKYKFACLGNMANVLYTRASVLRQKGVKISIFLHPFESYIMNQPCWEEFDGEITADDIEIQALFEQGVISKDLVEDVYQIPQLPQRPDYDYCKTLGTSYLNYKRFTNFMTFLSTAKAVQSYDALMTANTVYLAYLSNKPYAAIACGGDIWFEASRDDMLGRLQRAAFKNANVLFVADPLALAHSRRHGFSNGIYIPHYLDQKKYSPGHSRFRSEWQNQYGGDFFILTSARLDDHFKGSTMAFNATIQFLIKHSNARLALIGWGSDKDKIITLLNEANVLNQVILLPVCGKERLIQYLRSADCFLGQFILGAYGHADLEALACALPVIAYINENQYNYLCPTGSPPILQAQESDRVFQHLELLIHNKDQRTQLGQAARKWFIENHGSETWYTDHLALLVALAKGKKINFRNSILKTKLSRVEKEYHQNELQNAPIFPNYLK